MPVSVRLSELSPITQAQLTDSDLFLVTDSEATSSKKLTLSDFKQHLFSGNSFAEFNDVDLVNPAPSDGQFLRYDAATQRWKAGDISLSSLGELSDVDLVTNPPVNGDSLVWDGTKFVPSEIDLDPIYTVLGIPEDQTHLGSFTGEHLDENQNLKMALQTLSNAISTEVSNRTNADTGIDTRLQTAETSVANLEVAMAPETLNSINELAAALGDDPTAFATLQTSHATLSTSHSTLSTNFTTGQATQDGRLDALEADVAALDIDLAPETLNSINELSQALNDDPNFLQTVNNTIQTNTTDISNIETILYKLVPEPPTTMAGMNLNISTNGGTRRLCRDFTDRTGGTSGYQAGDQIKRNTDGSITTTKIHDIGPGDSGEISIEISQNSYDVSTTMASGTQTVDFMGLKITDNKDASLSTRDSGIPAGFYQVYDIQLVNAAMVNETDGLHYVQYTHAGNSTNKAYFYEDESDPGAPTLLCSSVYIPSSPVLNYSSGVPHYSNHADNGFGYSLIGRNLSGEMYIQNTLATASQTAGFTHEGNKTYVDFGDGTNPPAKNFGVGINKIAPVTQVPRDLHITADNNVFSQWTITTPYGSVNDRPTFIQSVNIMGNTARTDVVDEDNILIDNVGVGAGNAYRVGDPDGDNPVPTHSTWDPLATPADHEATVVGGVLAHDVTDYSTGYYPVGPDLSSRDVDPQYATFEIRRSAVSQFTISYTGSCSGCWVTMPDNTGWQNSLSGTNGWADMFQAYRGSGVPTTAEPGCSSGGVMDNNGGTFTCVFGTESSSNDTENRILVRWKLADDQAITSMSFA